jgi:Arc/MetJ-type ribon-helix-helix transcriptional regulator
VLRKIAITLEQQTVLELDRWVREGKFPNRSRAVQSAVSLFAERQRRGRLALELPKLDPAEEKALAEEGMASAEWPPY